MTIVGKFGEYMVDVDVEMKGGLIRDVAIPFSFHWTQERRLNDGGSMDSVVQFATTVHPPPTPTAFQIPIDLESTLSPRLWTSLRT